MTSVSRSLAQTDLVAPFTSSATLSREDAPLPRAPLRLRLDDGRELVLDGRLTLGSAPDCDFVIADPYVSAHQCVIQRQGFRTLLRDGASRNGTYVSGVRVEAAELRAGTSITVGNTTLRVVADEHEGNVMIGISMALNRLRTQVAKVAPSRASVLVLGESGTGKELAAEALHRQSGRRGSFVVLNCGAISPALVESELFGHERGAFTGATSRRCGVFEEAHGGTLFLDEIGELPLALQPKLLRALESGSIRAVGASTERRVDVRVIAATHRDLAQAIREGAFRLDLYHRLAKVEICVPALRDRSDDIPLLAGHFLDEITAETGPREFGSGTLEAMLRWSWPGNIRELRNAIHRAALLGTPTLRPEDVLPLHASPPLLARRGDRDGQSLADMEREAITSALANTRGNRRAAAHALGMPKSTLCDKVRRYGISV